DAVALRQHIRPRRGKGNGHGVLPLPVSGLETLPAGMISNDYTLLPLWRNGAEAVKIVSLQERMRTFF
ncbi:MAG: hypothetical protein Q8S29_06875, partial [Phreatobacter sp.]|nr:hypothetical protein [Phreatobacter sp.]